MAIKNIAERNVVAMRCVPRCESTYKEVDKKQLNENMAKLLHSMASYKIEFAKGEK